MTAGEKDLGEELFRERFGVRRVRERHVPPPRSREAAMSPAERLAEISKALAPRKIVYGVTRHEGEDHEPLTGDTLGK